MSMAPGVVLPCCGGLKPSRVDQAHRSDTRAESKWPRRCRGAVSVERDRLVPVRDVHVQAQRGDLWGELRLGPRIAVDQEDAPRESGVAGALAVREPCQPGEQPRLIRVGGEAADRGDPAADVAHLPIQAHGLRALLQLSSKRPLALVPVSYTHLTLPTIL